MEITITDRENNRTVTYDNLKRIRIEHGVVKIFDHDGWGTLENVNDYEFVIEDD